MGHDHFEHAAFVLLRIKENFPELSRVMHVVGMHDEYLVTTREGQLDRVNFRIGQEGSNISVRVHRFHVWTDPLAFQACCPRISARIQALSPIVFSSKWGWRSLGHHFDDVSRIDHGDRPFAREMPEGARVRIQISVVRMLDLKRLARCHRQFDRKRHQRGQNLPDVSHGYDAFRTARMDTTCPGFTTNENGPSSG